MPAVASLIIVPPASTRASSSKADKDIVAGMVAGINADTWVTDGATYDTYKLAQNGSGLYRRALPKALNVPAHTLKSKVWGIGKDGAVVTDRDKKAEWKFAFTLDPNRPKRTRAPKSTTSA